MPAAVTARAARDGSPAAIAARPVPGEAVASDVADGWSVALGCDVTEPAPGARKWARAEAVGVPVAVMVLPGEVPPPPGVVAVRVPPDAVLMLPVEELVPPAAMPAPPGAVPTLPGGVTTAWAVVGRWLSTEVADVVMPLTALVAVVTIGWVVPSSWVSAEVAGAVMLPTVPPSEVTVPVPVVRTWVTVEVTGPVTLATVPVSEDVRALPVPATWLPVEDTVPLIEDAVPPTEDTELVSAEVAGWLADATCPTADWTVPALPVATFPTVCVAADVAPDTVDVTAEAGALVDVAGALVDAAVLAAGAADADPEPAATETVDWLVETTWPTAEDTPAATEEALVAAAPPEPLWAVVAPGLVAAEADLAVRRDSPIATPMAARAMPAAHRQNRRTLVTSPLVTTVTLIRPGHPV